MTFGQFPTFHLELYSPLWFSALQIIITYSSVTPHTTSLVIPPTHMGQTLNLETAAATTEADILPYPNTRVGWLQQQVRRNTAFQSKHREKTALREDWHACTILYVTLHPHHLWAGEETTAWAYTYHVHVLVRRTILYIIPTATELCGPTLDEVEHDFGYVKLVC